MLSASSSPRTNSPSRTRSESLNKLKQVAQQQQYGMSTPPLLSEMKKSDGSQTPPSSTSSLKKKQKNRLAEKKESEQLAEYKLMLKNPLASHSLSLSLAGTNEMLLSHSQGGATLMLPDGSGMLADCIRLVYSLFLLIFLFLLAFLYLRPYLLTYLLFFLYEHFVSSIIAILSD
jgi:hypothetical protein